MDSTVNPEWIQDPQQGDWNPEGIVSQYGEGSFFPIDTNTNDHMDG